MAEKLRTGGCARGAVRYEVRGEPIKVGLCHCTDCRKETGSTFLYYADWWLKDFSVIGAYVTYEGRSFSPICGSRLFHVDHEGTEICLGSLDEAPIELVPSREGWIKRREPWLHAVEGASQHREDPTD